MRTWVLSSSVLMLFAAGAVRGAEPLDNDALTTEMAALIGVHNAALPPSFIPDPFVGIPAGIVTYGANIGLKYVEPPLVVPPGWSDYPNSGDQCTFNFQLDQSLSEYSNLLGIVNTRPVADAWGEFTRDGDVDTFHANSDVNLTVRGPGVIPGRTDELPAQTVRIPAGRHTYVWRAETQISDAFDLIIPAALLGFNIGYYGAAFSDVGASAARQAARMNVAQEVMQNIAVEAGLIAGDQLGLFGNRPTVSHEREQEITVYDVLPPSIWSTRDVFQFEATDFGGVFWDRVADQIDPTVSASDACGRPHFLGNDHPPLLPIGATTLTWTVRDAGPTPGGGVNSRTLTQTIYVQDTQGPLMVPPPSLVVEVPAQDTGVDSASVNVGAPRVVDLADPSPTVTNTVPAFFPKDSRTPVVWSATDASGNLTQANQLITVKTEGENTAPVVSDIAASTLTSDPIDIVLSGSDADFIDGMFDPLSFRLVDRPDHGDFIAPLFPFFIEDYRTSPEGHYGEAFYLSGNRSNWLYNNVCQGSSLPYNDRIPIDWVYNPLFVHVTDDGTYFMIDHYWRCGASNASLYQRISKWDEDGNYIGQMDYGGTNDTFVMDQDGYLYTLSRNGAGSSTTLFLAQNRTNFETLGGANPLGDSWRFDFDSTENPALGLDDPISPEQLSYARIDSRRGLLYVTDRRRVFVFDVRSDFSDGVDANDNTMGDKYLGALKNAEQFLDSTWGNSWTGFAMDVDADGYLYVLDSGGNRVHKFTPSYFDENGDFVMGEYVGWMGRCDTSTNNACDEDEGVTYGYSCTDATCTVVPFRDWDDGFSRRGSVGWEPGQFNGPAFIALDPKGVLYVSDGGEPNAGGRVQRFASDGTFGGEARSTGTGVNQGERPGFILGNLGTVKAVSVNSTHFFVVDQDESFVHVFETTPLKDITNDSATVTYVSNFDFHSDTDQFSFVASDGLDDSNVGTVFVNVARNFRQPLAFAQSLTTDEDVAVDLVLEGDDPDGILGQDFNGLDTLTYRIVDGPSHGSVSDGEGADRTYTPDPDYFGEDAFTYVVNDGNEDSEPATVSLLVNPVDDAPSDLDIRLPERVSMGHPLPLRARYSDDGSSGMYTWIEWGDNTWSYPGDFVDGPNGPVLEGIKLIQPRAGDGVGQAVAEHLYTATGPRTLRFCLLDGTNADVCLERSFMVEALVNLGMEVDTLELEMYGGRERSIGVGLTNHAMRGVAGPGGLIAENVVVEGTFSSPAATFAGVDTGSCSPTASGFRCIFGTLDIAEEALATFRIRGAETGGDQQSVELRLRARTSSQALNDFVDRRVSIIVLSPSRDDDGDGLPDGYEDANGLNPSDASDASQDSDQDGLTNLEEYDIGTDPMAADTDGDGLNDGFEIDNGLDPRDASDCPDWVCGSKKTSGWRLQLLREGRM